MFKHDHSSALGAFMEARNLNCCFIITEVGSKMSQPINLRRPINDVASMLFINTRLLCRKNGGLLSGGIIHLPACHSCIILAAQM